MSTEICTSWGTTAPPNTGGPPLSPELSTSEAPAGSLPNSATTNESRDPATLDNTLRALLQPQGFVPAARNTGVLDWLQQQIARTLERGAAHVPPDSASRELERINRELLLRSRIEQIFLHQPDELFNELLTVILEVLESPFGFLAYFDEPDVLLIPCLTREMWPTRYEVPDPVVRLRPVEWFPLPWPQVLREKQTLLENVPPPLPEGHAPVRRFLASPILINQQPLGLVAVANKPADYFPDDQRHIELVTRCLAPILYNHLEREKTDQTRRRAEDALRQMQRMETIGTLAGGIAHEFNNLLAVILGHAELIRVIQGAPTSVAASANAILKSTFRARDLVRQLTEFSRPASGNHSPVALDTVVRDALPLLRVSLSARIRIDTNLDPETPLILASTDQLRQILLTLGANAAQAMPGTHGCLTLEVRPVILDPAQAQLHPGLKPGLHACLAITDTGHGMDPATQRRIFEPFFTTKPPGCGTGMGLAIVHRIVQDHHGAIEVSSLPGHGTSFRILFPACPIPEAQVPSTA